MAKKIVRSPLDYIVPLDMNGLEGRLLHVPAPKNKKNKEILFVYGHHSSLERWWGVVEVMNRYGAVTMPDLPGFGGMDSFYKVNRKPSVDTMADYLASVIKLRYKKRKFVIVGMSFGFVVATRMLQKYPDIAKRVKLMVSIVGFGHHEDFLFSKRRYYAYLAGTRLLSQRAPASFFRYVALHPIVLKRFYAKTHNAKHKFTAVKDDDEMQQLLDVEIGLWHDNDVRTWAYTTIEMLKLDNCQHRVDVPVWHVGSKSDHFFDNHLVEQHLRTIFKDYNSVFIDMGSHAPSVIANEKMAAPYFPPAVRRVLRAI